MSPTGFATVETLADAPLGMRALAAFSDLLVFGLMGGLMHLQLAKLHAPGLFYLWCLSGLAWLYFVVVPTRYGGTPGKLAVGLRVVGVDGALGLWEHMVRFVVWALSMGLAGLPFILVLTDRRHIGLHDRLAGTRVVAAPGVDLERRAGLADEVVVPVSVGAVLSFILMRPDILMPPPHQVGPLPLSAMDLRVAATLVPAVVAAMCAKPDRELAGLLQGAVPGAALTLFALVMTLLFYRPSPLDSIIWTNLLSGVALSAAAAWAVVSFRGPESAQEGARILGALLVLLVPLYIAMSQSEINGCLWVTLRSSPNRLPVPGVRIVGCSAQDEHEVFRTKTGRDGLFKVMRLRPANYLVYCEGQEAPEKARAAPVMLGGGRVNFYFEPSSTPTGDWSDVKGEGSDDAPER